jgi:hypothetical protein
MKLSDLSGRLIFENQIFNGYLLDIHNLAKGIYFVTMQYDSKTITKKIIKQ